MPRSGGRWGSTPCGGERTFVRSVCCIVARTERADGVKLVSSPPFGCSPLFRYHSCSTEHRASKLMTLQICYVYCVSNLKSHLERRTSRT